MLRIGPFLAILAGAWLAAQAAMAQESIATIYFDPDPGTTVSSAWSSPACELSPTARDLLAEVVARWRKAGKSDFVISGHDDQAGDKDLSLAISTCRANRVYQAVRELGVDPSQVYLYALGESRPAYNAADGQAEPLNRRVEIQFY